jgi:hypothetical protein
MKVGPEKFGTPPPRNFWNVRPWLFVDNGVVFTTTGHVSLAK